MDNKEPINNKVKKILEMMKYMNREDAAIELKYKDWRSMDSYMRRKNYRYDSSNKEYVLASTKTEIEGLLNSSKVFAPAKIVSIITAFELPNADPKLIAKQSGFKDHADMANYMKEKGYEWNIYRNNYVEVVGESNKEEKEMPEVFNSYEDGRSHERIEDYLPFIRFLYEKRDNVYQQLSGIREDGRIPRYAIPGTVRTKAIYMSDMIGRLTSEFSKEKNITQREIVEGALVEYLQKYGYKTEIENLLNN